MTIINGDFMFRTFVIEAESKDKFPITFYVSALNSDQAMTVAEANELTPIEVDLADEDDLEEMKTMQVTPFLVH